MNKLLALTILNLFMGQAMAENTHHGHHSKHSEKEKKHSTKSLSLNNGKKWQVDQTMRENMDAIRTEYKKINELMTAKKITEKDYAELSDLISNSAQKIASNCKMEEKQDETFHVVLADLLTVSEDLKNSKKAKHAMGKLTHALKVYAEFFDHPIL